MDALDALADDLAARAGRTAFYVFWFSGSAGAGGLTRTARPRTLVAFPTPDAALVFAQRSVQASLRTPPRVRRLTITQLLQAVAREPTIAALLLADEGDAPPPGQLPSGIRVERAAIAPQE